MSKANDEPKKRTPRPSISPEAVENRLINKTYKAVEKRIDSGEATAAELVHFLRMGSVKEQLELEKLKKENALLTAKSEAIQSQKEIKELYSEAISAFRRYSGLPVADEEEVDD